MKTTFSDALIASVSQVAIDL
ncbi:unnamed protein product [Lathyrus oleraceus]